jgi:hypothetical protein
LVLQQYYTMNIIIIIGDRRFAVDDGWQ